jgi:hypothetical protein
MQAIGEDLTQKVKAFRAEPVQVKNAVPELRDEISRNF